MGRLTEAGGATSAQMELNKKRESEVNKLRKDLEEAQIQQEATMQNLKRKHQDAVAEMSEQIDQLSKMKAKIEKDKNQIMHETADVRAATDEIGRSKAPAEKTNKNLVASLNDANKKVEEANLNLGDYENTKRKIAAENADLLRTVQKLENSANMLQKIKIQLASQLDGMRDHMEEESSSKDDVVRQLNKAMQEADMWRQKFEKEGLMRAEELEMAKMKMQARLSEAQGTIEQLNAKM